MEITNVKNVQNFAVRTSLRYRAWDKEKILSPHEKSKLRPSDSALRDSTTEPQRLHGERGL